MQNVTNRILLLFRTAGILLFLFVFLPAVLYSQAESTSLAVLPFENMNGNPEQDYLKGIISYTLEEKGAIKAGQLLGASFMLKGSYVFPGQDIFN